MLKNFLRRVKLTLSRIYGLRAKEILFLSYKKFIFSPLNKLIFLKNQTKYIDKLHTLSQNQNIFIYPPNISWQIPLFQRPQQLAYYLSFDRNTYLFCSDMRYDHFFGIKHLTNNLYLIDKKLFRKLNGMGKKKILILQPNTLQNFTYLFIEEWLSTNNLIIYDYLDELSEEVFGYLGDNTLQMHINILSNEKIICLATSHSLYRDAQKFRTNNLYYLPNGVDITHFKTRVPNLPSNWRRFINTIQTKNQKVIGYFGAIAQWIDYELLLTLAHEHPDKLFLLIGHYYYSHYKKFQKQFKRCKNIIVSDAVPYPYLPEVAQVFDVAIIPFLINDITLATSPIKLFEYMALGKPIISTALPECAQYPSVLTASSAQEFSQLINKALALKTNSDYLSIQKEDALRNTWESRAKKINELVNAH